MTRRDLLAAAACATLAEAQSKKHIPIGLLIYAVLADTDTFGKSSQHVEGEDELCCASVPESQARCCS